MDTAVALVESYLWVNGYFTVAEYPVLEAVRFPGAGRREGAAPPSSRTLPWAFRGTRRTCSSARSRRGRPD